MKHILPILTAVLALAATTASAVDYYNSIGYYNDADYQTPEQLKKQMQYYAITYEQQTIDYGSYQIVRTSPDWGSFSNGEIINRYKIRITGESVDLYLADWMDTATGVYQTDALINKDITSYGYHFVDNKTHEVAGETWNMADVTQNQEDITEEKNKNRFGVLEKYPVADGKETLRHGYYLGNFTTGDEIEIYMKDTSGEVYSDHYGDQGGRYDAPNYDQVVAARMGYLNNITEAQKAEARKAMPLAELEPTGGHTVFFGIYAGPAPEVAFIKDKTGNGAPLPGGLQIALIAGLFGLGFWYIRRRKAIAV